MDLTKQVQNRFHVPLNYPIKDLYYYVQLNRMLGAKQYYNYTYDYLLPELEMGTRDKLIYLEQTVNNGYYDNDIFNLYSKFTTIIIDKLSKFKNNPKARNIINQIINTKSLSFLYNNLDEFYIPFIENEFNAYYERKLQEHVINSSQLYLNSVERYNVDEYYTNKIVPFQSYNNMICGLQIYSFSLHPLEYQPSGYANFSALKPEFNLELSENSKNLRSTDILNCHILGRGYNIMRFISGIAGMAWS